MKTTLRLILFLTFSLLATAGWSQCFSPVESFTAVNTRSITTADFNNDGYPDLLTWVNYPEDYVYIHLNDKANPGQFNGHTKIDLPEFNDIPVVADFSHDGYADFIVKKDFQFYLYINKGESTVAFLEPVKIIDLESSSSTADLLSGDFNGDGYPDLLVIDETQDQTYLRLNDPEHPGTFLAASSLINGDINSYDATTVDWNGDGKTDFFGEMVDGGNYTYFLYLRNSSGTAFEAPVEIPLPEDFTFYRTSVAFGDLNGDGKTDVVGEVDYNLGVMLNQNNDFTSFTRYTGSQYLNSTFLRDVNLDGYLDIIVSDENSVISIYLNTPANPGTFQEPTTYVGDGNGHKAVMADFNKDGLEDLAHGFYDYNPGNYNESVVLFFNCAPATLVKILPLTASTVCVGSPVSVTATATNFTPTSYTWSSLPAGFSGSGSTTTLTAPTVASPTTFTLTVTAVAGGITRTSSTTLLVQPAPTAPNLTFNGSNSASVIQNTPFVSLNIANCPGGTLTWKGPDGSSGTGTTISVPTSATGTLVYSATCSVGSCTSPPGSATISVTPPLVTGSFDGFVYGADCASFRGWAWDRNKVNTAISVDILDGPTVIASFLADVFRQDLQTAGKGNGKHAFSWTIPGSLKDGLPHNLSARVSGSNFILKDSPKALICVGTGTPENKAPVPPSPTILIAPLAAQVGVPFSGTLVAFTDPEAKPLTYALTGLPDGLSINTTSRVISGTPTVAGTFVLAYSATDEGGLTNSVSFLLTVNPASTTTVTGDFEGYLDKLDCGGIRGWVWDRKKPNTPLTVEFFLDGSGTVLGSTVANIYRPDLKDAGKGNGSHAYSFSPPAPVTNGTLVRARVLGSTFELKGSPKVYQCAPARLSAETGSQLQVTVLGNPVSDELQVEIRGAEGQALRLHLTDASGRLLNQRQIETANAVEQQRFSVQGQAPGLLLLQVRTLTQSRTLKIIKR
ncbi:FG-GAP repeat domain-containing protein [Larkinella terrae]|nr:VCBS repeat-containing protein [Larkinella terrae]